MWRPSAQPHCLIRGPSLTLTHYSRHTQHVQTIGAQHALTHVGPAKTFLILTHYSPDVCWANTVEGSSPSPSTESISSFPCPQARYPFSSPVFFSAHSLGMHCYRSGFCHLIPIAPILWRGKRLHAMLRRASLLLYSSRTLGFELPQLDGYFRSSRPLAHATRCCCCVFAR